MLMLSKRDTDPNICAQAAKPETIKAEESPKQTQAWCACLGALLQVPGAQKLSTCPEWPFKRGACRQVVVPSKPERKSWADVASDDEVQLQLPGFRAPGWTSVDLML